MLYQYSTLLLTNPILVKLHIVWEKFLSLGLSSFEIGLYNKQSISETVSNRTSTFIFPYCGNVEVVNVILIL